MKSPGTLAALTAALGLAATAVVWRAARTAEDRGIRARFQDEARNWRDNTADQMDHFISVLNSIRYLHNLSESISANDFSEFVSKGMRYQQETLGVFGFAQHVTREARAEFESAGPYTIFETDERGLFRPAADRADYYPVLYQSPEKSLGLPPGFDLGSEMINGQAIERMRATAIPALAGALKGPDGSEARLVFSPILLPVYDEQAQAFTLYMRGFAFALLHPAEILNRALPAETVESVGVELSPEPVAAPQRGASSPDERRPASGGYSEPAYEDVVFVANEAWRFRCVATPGYLAARRSRQPATLFASGSIISALLGLQVYLLAGRARRTEEIVRQRTRELRGLQAEILDVTTREQQRLGRDLHDSLGQKLAGAVFLSKALADETPALDAARAGEAVHLNEILKESVAQVRMIARGLSPVDLGEDGLVHALRRLADETTEVFGVACSFKPVDAPAMDAKSAAYLYHIAQEAVTNAVRHGKARDITIRLRADHLAVEDNGQGFAPAADAQNGAGLRIMKYRAEMIGGSLDIDSRLGKTVVICKFSTTDKAN